MRALNPANYLEFVPYNPTVLSCNPIPLRLKKRAQKTHMPRPHDHHILFKKGIGKTQQELVQEGQAILRKHGIDPIKGSENLIKAPNIKGQHTLENLEEVVQRLKDVDAAGAMREDIIDVLTEMGKKAARRR